MSATQEPTQDKSASGASHLSQAHGIPFPKYFAALAATYNAQTGDTTRNLFAAALDDITAQVPLTSSSRVHDNAAGPGTAASVLVDRLTPDSLPKILVTDRVAAMVSAARESFAHVPSVTAAEMDSLALSGVADGSVTHSILNFSIFAISDPLQCVREVRRTLAGGGGGVAALLTWRRFGAGEVVRAAQALVRPDLPPMAYPHPEFWQPGVLAALAVEAGFDEANVTVLEKSVAVGPGPQLDGLRGFWASDFVKPARVGWTDEEVARWPAAVEQAVQAEIDARGGVLFQAYVVLART
ncbi:S-adenosyl-L-methionine-dependent methyltransferase [Lasiosphaeria ovina]|uniref:S-adenosyl-L-methionine-dependent methyltransferase n=1 Tax=Lasiosphaeria ovina TaxID=92902 RepID=A0AAE0JYD6_9PEZI|nr:S-adenosyl-L-methionine-dependent methyltransferase [Lasiosphaeria ovina]